MNVVLCIFVKNTLKIRFTFHWRLASGNYSKVCWYRRSGATLHSSVLSIDIDVAVSATDLLVATDFTFHEPA